MNRDDDELHLTLTAALVGVSVGLAAFGQFKFALFSLAGAAFDGAWLLYTMDSAGLHGNPATARQRTWLRFARGAIIGLVLPVLVFGWALPMVSATVPLGLVLAYLVHRRLLALEVQRV